MLTTKPITLVRRLPILDFNTRESALTQFLVEYPDYRLVSVVLGEFGEWWDVVAVRRDWA